VANLPLPHRQDLLQFSCIFSIFPLVSPGVDPMGKPMICAKIYNKLLFVCGDENIKSESYIFPYFSTNCIGSHDGKNIKFESKKIGKRVLLAQSCPEQPMLQAYKGLPDMVSCKNIFIKYW
jgi:hypothetical protein